MDQQAKKHLQEEFDASLEEKDQYISVLQTQVKKKVWNFWIKENKGILMGYLIGSGFFFFKGLFLKLSAFLLS